jgi:hypothetical protein
MSEIIEARSGGAGQGGGQAGQGEAGQRNREVNPSLSGGSDKPPLMSVVDRVWTGEVGLGLARRGWAGLGYNSQELTPLGNSSQRGNLTIFSSCESETSHSRITG